MRILQSGIYDNFIQDQSASKKQIDKLTQQISSGKKIAHSYENSGVYVDTLRLDSEINALKGVQDRTIKSKTLTDSSDSAMGGMTDALRDLSSKLILASNGTLDENNLRSLASELEGAREGMRTLANSSINGQYLFSGTAVNVQPIDKDGNYHGNDISMTTLVSNGTRAPYTLDGNSLFLGVDNTINKMVSTNVHLQNQNTQKGLVTTDTVGDLMGAGNSTFKLSGVRHDGEAFKSTMTFNENDTISLLLNKIESSYGEGTVEATLTTSGTIMIKDLKKGSSRLDFQMNASNGANQIALTKNNHTLAVANNDDSAYFKKKDNVLMGNVSLLAKGEIATNATKMSEISNSTLLGKSFEMQLTDVNGVDKTVKLDLANPSSFSVNGTSYPIVDADGVTPTSADNFSLSQLNNVISMAMADSLPTGGRSYEEAVVESKKSVSVSLDSAGVLSIKDKTGDNNAIKFSMYDSDPASSSLSFMANRAVIVDNPKVDFFKDLDTIIEAVRNGNLQPDANSNDPLNPGISNAITKLSNLSAHLSTQYSKLGSMSSNLQNAHDRAQTVETSVKQLKSEVTDIDIAQTVIEYQQVSLNYQAMMSTISKVNSLTLLNYLR